MSILAVTPVLLYGVNYSWNAGIGNWNTATNWLPNGVPGAGDNVTTNSTGTIILTNDVTVNNFTSFGSIITGNFNININGTLSFPGGFFDGVATITVAGATTFPSGLPSLFGGSVLRLNGGGSINAGCEIRLSGGSQIIIPTGQTLTKTTAGDEFWATGNGGTLVVQGTFNKNGTGGLFMDLYKMNCTGTININQGNLFHTFSGGTNTFNGASITIAAGSFYGPNGGSSTFTNCTISGGGSFGSTGNRTIASGNVISSNMYMSGGTHTINQDISPAAYTITNGTLNGTGSLAPAGNLTLSGGTIGNTGNWTVGGNFNWSGGTMTGTGTVTVQSAANISGTATKLITTGKTLVLNGGGDWQGAGGLSIGAGATIRNAAGQTFTRSATGGSMPGPGTFDNKGTFLHATTGTTTVGAACLNTGTVKGTGTISWGTLTNNGTIAPGLSPGILTMNKFDNTAATLAIELAGTGGAGTLNGHDQLIVNSASAITLGGTVEVDFLNGFNPSTGTFVLLTYAGTASGVLPVLTCATANCNVSNMELLHNPADKTLSLVVNAPPVCSVNADAGADQAICLGSSITLTAGASGGTAPYAYEWSNGQSTQSISVSPVATTSYAVTVTDADGCTDDDTVVVTVDATDNDSDGYAGCNDCNDNAPAIHPGASEICDGLDNDCDGLIDNADPDVTGQITFYADTDGDGYGNAGNSILSCFAPSGYVSNDTDCDDTNAAVNPGAMEICNGLDDDCDGQTDEGLQTTFYADNDGDGFGNANSGIVTACEPPAGYSSFSTDCNDANPAIYPGATEVCNLLDDNCNGLIDDGLPMYTYYLDADGDGYGNPNISITTCIGVPEAGYVTPFGNGPYGENGGGNGGGGNGGGGNGSGEYFDSDDNNPQVNPGMPEVCNGIDDDSDGLIDEEVLLTFYTDSDGDTYGDPNGPTILACTAPPGFSSNNTDCDDTNPAVNPASPEVCNSLDDNCDGQVDNSLVFEVYYSDTDGDGEGDPVLFVSTCDGPPVGYVLNDDDCDDADPEIYPGAPEICDGLDNDCNGLTDDADPNITGQPLWYADADADGFGNPNVFLFACTQPHGYVSNNDDCNDTNAEVHPNATEVCNGFDDNCDGLADDADPNVNGQIIWYADADEDGYGNPDYAQTSCDQPSGYVSNNNDCDDTNQNVHPGVEETCNDLDDDCDGLTDEGCLNPLIVDAGTCQVVYYGYQPLSCTMLNTMVSGGNPPYSYAWSNGMTGASIQVCPTTSQAYTVTVTDDNGNTSSDGVTVEVLDVRCGNNNTKVLLCHNGTNTLCVGSNAVADHLGHGDYLGTCGNEPCIEQNGAKPVNTTATVQVVASEQRIICFPNPASNKVEVLAEGTDPREGVFELADFMGRVIRRMETPATVGDLQSIDLTGVQPGAYLLIWSVQGQILATKTFIVQ